MNSKHYNINQLRIDLWNELKEKSNHLTRIQQGDAFDNHLKELNDVLQNLLSIEQYFSFPGTSLVRKLMTSFEKREFKAISNHIAEIVSLLVSDNYRTHPEILEEKFSNGYTKESSSNSIN